MTTETVVSQWIPIITNTAGFCKQCKTKQTAITLYYYYAHKLHLLKLKKAKQFHPISRIVSNQHQFTW